MNARALGRIAMVGALLALVAVALFTLAHDGHQTARAAGGTPDEAIAIDVNGGGDDCDTRPSTGGIGTTCNVSVGSMFTVKGLVDSFTGISGAGGYGGIRFRYIHSAGLTLNQRAGTAEIVWPDCTGPSETKPASSYQAECHDFVGPDSTFIGKVLEVDYTCTMAGAQTVTMQDANTFFFDSAHSIDNSDKDGDEVLTINCVAAVGGIARLPQVSNVAPLAAENSSTSWSAWLIALAVLAGGVVVVGGAAWRLRSRRID